MDEYLKLIVRLQALSQNGLAYVNNEFDKERYEEIRDIACQLMKYKTDLPFEKIKDLFGSEQGYQTPKIDTRAAIFKDNRFKCRIFRRREKERRDFTNANSKS
mgnify:CR=1 FL=1